MSWTRASNLSVSCAMQRVPTLRRLVSLHVPTKISLSTESHRRESLARLSGTSQVLKRPRFLNTSDTLPSPVGTPALPLPNCPDFGIESEGSWRYGGSRCERIFVLSSFHLVLAHSSAAFEDIRTIVQRSSSWVPIRHTRQAQTRQFNIKKKYTWKNNLSRSCCSYTEPDYAYIHLEEGERSVQLRRDKSVLSLWCRMRLQDASGSRLNIYNCPRRLDLLLQIVGLKLKHWQ